MLTTKEVDVISSTCDTLTLLIETSQLSVQFLDMKWGGNGFGGRFMMERLRWMEWEGSGEGELGLMSQKRCGRRLKERQGWRDEPALNSLQKVWDGHVHGPSSKSSRGADDIIFENYSIIVLTWCGRSVTQCHFFWKWQVVMFFLSGLQVYWYHNQLTLCEVSQNFCTMSLTKLSGILLSLNWSQTIQK